MLSIFVFCFFENFCLATREKRSFLDLEFFRDVKSYLSPLFIIPLILAEFYNAGQNILIWNLGNVTQSKKGNFVSRRKWVRVGENSYTNCQKRKFVLPVLSTSGDK